MFCTYSLLGKSILKVICTVCYAYMFVWIPRKTESEKKVYLFTIISSKFSLLSLFILHDDNGNKMCCVHHLLINPV